MNLKIHYRVYNEPAIQHILSLMSSVFYVTVYAFQNPLNNLPYAYKNCFATHDDQTNMRRNVQTVKTSNFWYVTPCKPVTVNGVSEKYIGSIFSVEE
jgi:hypothetical protein